METLSPRQQAILNRVIDTHIETAQPVGSHSITQLYRELYQGSYSPATVRHEMGALENMGYLTHPHTSAGRIPTDLGYRYYVDHSLRHEVMPHEAFRKLLEGFPQSRQESDAFAQTISQAVSRMSEEVALVLLPNQASKKREDRFKWFLQGASNLLEKPEFQDLEKIRILFRVFEERAPLVDWVTSRSESVPVSVTIGRENEPRALHDCAVISIAYPHAEGKGFLAIIGPRRMRYGRLIAMIEHMAQMMHQLAERISPYAWQ